MGYCKKGGRGMKVAGTIRSFVSAILLRLECARVLHESLLMPGLIYGKRDNGKEGEAKF